jgi:hypothetical protein
VSDRWFNTKSTICELYFQWDDDEIRFVLDKHASLDIYTGSVISRKQQSVDRHVAPLWHISPIPSNQSLIILINAVWFDDLIFGVLTPLSTIFQLYHGDQF